MRTHFILVSLVFELLLSTCTAGAKKSADTCREDSLEENEPIATADIIVIGSGPGGTAFLHRLIRQRPDLTVLWIEKGLDFVARNWPQDFTKSDKSPFTPVPRFGKRIQGYTWNTFGGGDAANSGGPNLIRLERPLKEPYAPVDVSALRNHSIIPLTDTSSRYLQAFSETGYRNDTGPIYTRENKENRVGQISSLRSPDGRDRMVLANDIRYSESNKVTYVHARVTSIIHEITYDDEGQESILRATGVRGVRVDYDQNEYGGCVIWKARKAVVLSAGVFNSFDILVESGLGPQEALDIREVPDHWRKPNEKVGKGIGDEFPAIFLSVEPEAQDQFGAEARLAAESNVGEGSYTLWTTGVFTWLSLENPLYNFFLDRFLPKKLPGLNRFVRRILDRASIVSISMRFEPNMNLIATKKPQNATSVFARNNPIGVKVDDTLVEFTEKHCQDLTKLLEPLKRYIELHKAAPKKFSVSRFAIALLSRLRILNLIRPNPITAQNINRYTGKGKNKGKKCNMNMVTAYFHFYGGNAHAVNDNFTLKGTQNLYVSDASLIERLGPGAACSIIMEYGMRVADAFISGDVD